jgi:hypothetical protein
MLWCIENCFNIIVKSFLCLPKHLLLYKFYLILRIKNVRYSPTALCATDLHLSVLKVYKYLCCNISVTRSYNWLLCDHIYDSWMLMPVCYTGLHIFVLRAYIRYATCLSSLCHVTTSVCATFLHLLVPNSCTCLYYMTTLICATFLHLSVPHSYAY